MAGIKQTSEKKSFVVPVEARISDVMHQLIENYAF